tara:strand:+ start:9907 stop:10815 length:909 start_codon:yes stop_codon:yes gene_type:complete
MATTLEQKRREAAKREKARKEKIANRKKNIGKEGYDRYGVLTAAGKKAQDKKAKEQKAAKARAKANAREMAREREGIKSRAESKKQVEKLRKTTNNFGKGFKTEKSPQKTAAQKKRKKVTTASEISAGKAKKFATDGASAYDKKYGFNPARGSKKPKARYFDDPNISAREKRIAKRSLKRKDRQDDRAERIALRKDITFDEAKALQGERKLKRKQFLRDFAANLAGVEQSQVRGQINTKDMSKAFGKSETAKPDAVKAQESEQASNKESIDNIFKRFTSSGNEGLGDIGFSTTNPYDLFQDS